MLYTNVILCFFGYCMSENMSSYKLLSNTPITKYCPDDSQHIYKIYEKHPSLPEITMCCATRISYKFMLTEKICLKKMDPKYITVNILKYLYYLLYLNNYNNYIQGTKL